ncbi:MAG TPA: type II toxin-antitoxin system HicB family antitoxin [Candidatus Paceibacterota bacterium]
MKKKLIRKLHEYTVFFDPDIEDVYTVTVPSLPGLVTEGKGIEEAIKMAKEAIKCYIEGLKKMHKSIPEERQIVQMRKRFYYDTVSLFTIRLAAT